MKQVFSHIAKRSDEYAREPLFAYLRNPAVDPGERLGFVPWAAHFVMTFADLYHFFLRVEQPRDRYEELANIHLSEEGPHWKWFLTDLANVGMDPTLRFTDALRVLWGAPTQRTRQLSYEICKLSAGLTSLERLVMLNTIEATGKVTLEAFRPAGRQVEARSGRRLVYFGDQHVDSEHQHTLEDSAVRRSLEEIELDEAVRAELCSLVDRVFEHFRGFSDDSYRIAKSGKKFVESVTTLEATG
jgi:hypothetical protein